MAKVSPKKTAESFNPHLERMISYLEQPEIDLTEDIEVQERVITEVQAPILGPMTRSQIEAWRPQVFADFAGASNRRCLGRLQKGLLRRTIPSPLLFVAEYGSGKTSAARSLLKSLNCTDQNPITADPCHQCQQCRSFGRLFNGTGCPFARTEIDCTDHAGERILDRIRELKTDNSAIKQALFFDELHRLPEQSMQERLLKFTEDFHGIFIAAVMEDKYDEIIPPLQDRFRTVFLKLPTAVEMVEHYCQKCREWEIYAEKSLVELVVERSGGSFRKCQQVLAAVADEDERVLAEILVDDMLPLSE